MAVQDGTPGPWPLLSSIPPIIKWAVRRLRPRSKSCRGRESTLSYLPETAHTTSELRAFEICSRRLSSGISLKGALARSWPCESVPLRAGLGQRSLPIAEPPSQATEGTRSPPLDARLNCVLCLRSFIRS